MTKINRRRDNHEGSINKVKGSNRWRVRGWVRQPDGSLIRQAFYGQSKSEAKANHAEAIKRAESGAKTTVKETVAEYLDRWHDNDKTLRPRTIESRLLNIDRMNKYIGAEKLTDLRHHKVRAMYDSLREDLSEHSVRQVHATLMTALTDAEDEGDIIVNPLRKMKNKPNPKMDEVRPITSDQVTKLLSINDKWTPFFAVLIGTGLRKGEALGLTWDNVDLDSDTPTLKVVKTMQHIKGEGKSFGEPKTKQSRREIPLVPPVVQALKTHLLNQNILRLSLGSHWIDNDLVFPNSVGELMDTSVASRNLNRACKTAGISRHVRVHDLRHTFATQLHARGTDSEYIRKLLGHSKVQITIDLYIRTSPESLRGAISPMSDFMVVNQ